MYRRPAWLRRQRREERQDELRAERIVQAMIDRRRQQDQAAMDRVVWPDGRTGAERRKQA